MDKSKGISAIHGNCLNLLIVDDDEVTVNLLSEIFEKENYRTFTATDSKKALELISQNDFSVLISDIKMEGLNGIDLLSIIKNKYPGIVVILMTAFGSMDTAVEAIQKGAFDYISKPFEITDLKALVKRAIEHWRAQNQSQNISSDLPLQPLNIIKTPVGSSPKIIEVYKTVARAALTNSNVLIIGESGTGKELIAKAIHDYSKRKDKKFVAVNCGSLAESLLESELFGHVRGSFTGALSDKCGLFEEADKGTIFLDEIGDISPSLQIKLLRVIQEGEYRPVGGKEIKKVDVRIVAATNKQLETLVKNGTFREDLFYRLKVITIELPPLRDRIEDLPELITYFLSRYSEKSSKAVYQVSREAMEILQSYHWPGNIRELENAIERAVAMTRTFILYPEDFPKEITEYVDNHTQPTQKKSKEKSMEEIEMEHIKKVLEEVNYNKKKAAEILAIDRATLYRKAKRYGISLNNES